MEILKSCLEKSHLAVYRSRGLAGAFVFQQGNFVAGFGDDHALVTDAGKGKIFEFADAFAQLLEGVFDGRDCLFFAAEQVDQIAQDFPVIVGLAGWHAGLIEALQATAEVDHRSAFFCESRGGEHDVGSFCRGVGQCVDVQVEGKFGEVFVGKSSIADEVFRERNERFDAAVAHAIADGCERACGIGALPDERGSRCVRIAIGGDE